MTHTTPLIPPTDLDWPAWVERWDRMQERYLVRRAERFEIVVRLIRETQPAVKRVVDLGCGTGSFALAMLDAFPGAELLGFDFDPTLLWLAKARLARFGNRCTLALADLRNDSWTTLVPGGADAVVSATALHWLMPEELSGLYRAIGHVLRPGGIFLNADHVGSGCAGLQQAWSAHRAEMREQEGTQQNESWESFWKAYSSALGLDVDEIHKRVVGGWEGGIEDGMPLAWHFDRLRESGFAAVDCFWRCDCDAIYGGFLGA